VLINDTLDVELFLLKTLEDERLTQTASSEKDAILKKLKALQDDYPQLRHFESDLKKEHEITMRTPSLMDSPRQQSKQIPYSDESAGKDLATLRLSQFCSSMCY